MTNKNDKIHYEFDWLLKKISFALLFEYCFRNNNQNLQPSIKQFNRNASIEFIHVCMCITISNSKPKKILKLGLEQNFLATHSLESAKFD